MLIGTDQNTIALERKKRTLWNRIWEYKYFYMMIIPVVTFYAIFAYWPMYGVTLAFKSFIFKKGILGSPWIGLYNFRRLMTSDPEFWNAFKNTIEWFAGSFVFTVWTAPLLAVLINEVAYAKFKKIVQTIYTFPHFISWIIISGIIIGILNQNGIFNQIVVALGGKPTSLLTQSSTFRPVIYITGVWKEVGWGSIIYLAAIASINPELYQAADIDGANRFRKMIHITWPGIRPTFTILMILSIGGMMSGGVSFDQIFNLYSAPVYNKADTLDTFIFRQTFSIGADYGYMTAVGLFKSLINIVLLYLANFIATKLGENGLF